MTPSANITHAPRPTLRLTLLASLFGIASVGHAAISWRDSSLQFGGFFSQGYLQSTHNNYPVDTKDGTADFREFGLNASVNVTSHLRLGAQGFGQRLGKYGHDTVILDWAVADYNFRPEIGVRVGRLKYPRSLQSDVLDLDVVRPFIFLPQSFYDARLRDFQASFDGGMLYGSLSAGQNTFDYKVYYGNLPMKAKSGVGDFFNNAGLYANPPGVRSLDSDSLRGASLMWGTPVTGLRIGVNYSELRQLEASGPFVAVPVLTSSLALPLIRYENASAEYTTGPWTFTAEYLWIKGSSLLMLPPALGIPPSAGKYGDRNYYVSVARRFATKFEAGTYYTKSQNAYPTTTVGNTRHDVAVALRYDYNEHLLFKIEGHAIHGTKDMFNVPGITNATLRDSMMLFAAKTTLSF